MTSKRIVVSPQHDTLPLVSIILVNWNGKEDILECLESLQKLDYPNYEIIIVDNGSTDGSPQIIKESFPWTVLIQNDKNLGFAEANNVGARAAQGRYIFLLNSDTVVDRQTLSEMVKVMLKDNSVGSCAPKVLFYHHRDIIESTGGCIDNVGFCYARPLAPQVDRGQFERHEEVFMASGGFALVKRNIVDKVGLFDPTLFFGYEELELGFKVRECGYKAVYVPTSKVYHKRHRSYSCTFTVQPTSFKMYRNARNRVKLIMKYFPLSFLAKNLPLILLSIVYWDLWLWRKSGIRLFLKAILSQVIFSAAGLKERFSRKGKPQNWLGFVQNHSLGDFVSFHKQGGAFFNGDLPQENQLDAATER